MKPLTAHFHLLFSSLFTLIFATSLSGADQVQNKADQGQLQPDASSNVDLLGINSITFPIVSITAVMSCRLNLLEETKT